MDIDTNIILIESESSPDTFYSVNITSLTCSCPIFLKKLRVLPLNNPHRLCKHLVQAVTKTGIPPFLTQYKSDIEWFARQKASFTNRDSVRHNNKTALPVGTIQKVATNKKRKYCHSEAIANGKKISATIPLQGGRVSYTINNLNAFYDTITQESFIPIAYRSIEQAVVKWITEEYNKVRLESAPLAIPKIIEYKPIEVEFPEGSVKTISIQKMNGVLELSGFGYDYDGKYFHIKGQIERESVEAVMAKSYPGIIYSINNSKAYRLYVEETKKHESSLEILRIDKLTLTFSSDLSDTFPKTYWFLEKAVLTWLKSEYDQISRNELE
jgi:hypothetical protein